MKSTLVRKFRAHDECCVALTLCFIERRGLLSTVRFASLVSRLARHVTLARRAAERVEPADVPGAAASGTLHTARRPQAGCQRLAIVPAKEGTRADMHAV